jgi:hypothetical protein
MKLNEAPSSSSHLPPLFNHSESLRQLTTTTWKCLLALHGKVVHSNLLRHASASKFFPDFLTLDPNLWKYWCLIPLSEYTSFCKCVFTPLINAYNRASKHRQSNLQQLLPQMRRDKKILSYLGSDAKAMIKCCISASGRCPSVQLTWLKPT